MRETEDAVVYLVAELDFPPDDVRSDIGALAVRIARAIDDDEPNFTVNSYGSMLRRAVQEMTSFPNDPPGMLPEFSLRILTRKFISALEYRPDEGTNHD